MTSLDDLLTDALGDHGTAAGSISDEDVESAMRGFRQRRRRRLTAAGMALGATSVAVGALVVNLADRRADTVLMPATSPGTAPDTIDPAPPVPTDPSTTDVEITTTTLGPSRPPIAQADVLAIEAGRTITIDVTANDTDPDGGRLVLVEIVDDPDVGEASITDWGTLRYAAPPFAATDRFTYRIEDPNGMFDVGTVTVEVIGPPDDETNS